MKANELRVGNWVMFDGEYEKVDGDFISRMFYSSIELDREGIQLTPELLEKAGFDNTKGSSTSNYKYWCTIGLVDVRFREDRFTVFEVGGGVRTIREHIKHLHQLQNFYHALTGNELEINL